MLYKLIVDFRGAYPQVISHKRITEYDMENDMRLYQTSVTHYRRCGLGFYRIDKSGDYFKYITHINMDTYDISKAEEVYGNDGRVGIYNQVKQIILNDYINKL